MESFNLKFDPIPPTTGPSYLLNFGNPEDGDRVRTATFDYEVTDVIFVYDVHPSITGILFFTTNNDV